MRPNSTTLQHVNLSAIDAEIMRITTMRPRHVTPTAVKVLKTLVLWAVLLGSLFGITFAVNPPDDFLPVIFLVGFGVTSFGMVTTQAVWSEW